MRALTIFLAYISSSVAAFCEAATIMWGNIHPEGAALARDHLGNPLWGTTEFGPTPTLSMGALVQLWKAVGLVDDPRMVAEAWVDTNWHIDDVLLDETHMGFGTFWDANGSWCQLGEYHVAEGDVLYVRVYNVSKPQFYYAPFIMREVGIRNDEDVIVTRTVGDVRNPQSLYFDNLRTDFVPEPASLLFLLPGLAIFLRKRARMTR